MWQFCGPQAPARDRSWVAAPGLARGGWELHHAPLLSTRCAPGRRAVRGFGPRPVPGRSARPGTRGLGFTPHLAPFHALRARDGARSVGSGRDRSPVAAIRLARGGWDFSTPCIFPRAARQGRRAVRWGSGRDRSPVAAIRLARGGWDLHHDLFVSTSCAPGTARGPHDSPFEPALN